MTVVALFGSSRALQLASRAGPIHMGRPGCSGAAAAPQLSLHLTNNSVVAFGGDVLDALGWEFGCVGTGGRRSHPPTRASRNRSQ
jgi:hypothetical protein